MYIGQKIPIVLRKHNFQAGKGRSVLRSVVHTKGYWHHSIQANIIRFSKQRKLQILIQKRSNKVDISKGKFDQSLATQVLSSDKTLKRALARGLSEELGIVLKETVVQEFLPETLLKIVKRYKENKSLFNREILHLYLIKMKKNRRILPNSPKVSFLKWEDWEVFARKIKEEPDIFTKTSRFYVVYDELRKELEETMIAFLRKSNHKSKTVLQKITFYSLNEGGDLVEVKQNSTNKKKFFI